MSSFFFKDTAPTEIYTLSLHDALPIYAGLVAARADRRGGAAARPLPAAARGGGAGGRPRLVDRVRARRPLRGDGGPRPAGRGAAPVRARRRAVRRGQAPRGSDRCRGPGRGATAGASAAYPTATVPLISAARR